MWCHVVSWVCGAMGRMSTEPGPGQPVESLTEQRVDGASAHALDALQLSTGQVLRLETRN